MRASAGKIWLVDTLRDVRLGYHVVRHVLRPESPFAGVLARDATGATALLVKVGELGGWPVGRMVGATEHELTPFDVISNEGAHEVVLPWCSETVDGFLFRRRAAAQPLTAGEVVTLGVCVLRGARELVAGERAGVARAGAGADGDAVDAGRWWLTLDGRPVFCPAAGEAEVEVHAATLEAIAEGCRDGGVAAVVRACAARLVAATHAADRAHAPGRWAGGVAAALEEGEDALFALSDPAPLEMRSLRPRPSRSLQGDFDAVLAGPQPEPAVMPLKHGKTGRAWSFVASQLRQATARHIDPEIADVATDTWRRTRGGAARVLRKPLVVAIVLVVLIVVVGTLWPDPGNGASTADQPHTISEGVVPAPAASGTAASPAVEPGLDEIRASEPAPPVLEGIAAVADALLVARNACHDDADCATRVYEDASAASRVAATAVADGASNARPLDAQPRTRSVVLIDDLGGVAVLRVALNAPVPGNVNAEMLIIVQTERGWRIRDVFDVLDAPPSGDA